jgi:hypothetical protein
MGNKMKMLTLPLVLFLITAQLGCKENFTYPELSNVSEIVVMDWGNPLKKISDPSLISKVVEFINKRREGGWETPMSGFPSTKVKIQLYRDGQFIGSFGITKSSFSMQRGGRWDSKPATEQEVQDFLNLLGIDKAMLE